MNHARKVVTSIAVGLALAVIAVALTSWIAEPSDGGWFVYSPDDWQDFNRSPGTSDWATPSVWLVSIGIWFVISWRLFRSRD